MNAQDLKNSILQLAVQGKLVEQRAEEGTARELLEQIKLEKDQLIKDKKIKKSKPLPEITEEEIPFEIPESWEWVRWGELSFSIQYGYNAPAIANGQYKMVRISDIQNNKVLWDTVPYCEIKDDDVETYQLAEDDILFARTGGTVGKSFLVKEVPCNAVYAGYLIRTRFDAQKLVPEYLKFFMESQLYWQQLRNGTIATAQPNCNGQTLSKMMVPIPPLEEQHRIVAKIEEILPYIDQYDKAYTKLEIFNKKFPEDMKKSILQMAMQGKLVEQRPEEGTADELYEQIVAEKAQLIKDGKIKKEKPLPEIAEDEIPFEIPSSWKWVRFGELACFFNGDRSKNYPNKNEYVQEGIAWINTGHITQDGYLSDKTMNYITEKKYNSLSGGFIKLGDLVYCLRGATFGKVARVEPFELGAIASSLVIIRLITSQIREYIFNYLKSPLSYMELHKYDNGSAQPNLAAKDVTKYLIPRPPLEEQKRIVAKIEEFLPYCDQLIKN